MKNVAIWMCILINNQEANTQWNHKPDKQNLLVPQVLPAPTETYSLPK